MNPVKKFSRKNIFCSVLTFLVFTFLSATHSAWAKPPKDKPTVISPPVAIKSPNGERTRAVDINDRGVVVGTYGGLLNIARSFIWTERRGFRDIGEFTATAINNCGEITAVVNLYSPGSPVDPTLPTRTVVIRNNKIIDLGKINPTSPTSWAYATDINDRGHVSGIAGDTADSSARPFLWTPERGIQLLDGPEFHSGAYAINNRDEVVGYKQPDEFNGLQRPALWSPGQPVKLVGGLGGRFGTAGAVNDATEMVGNSETDLQLFPLRAGFFWSETDGVKPLQPYENQQLDTASQARAINSHGHIVGSIWVGDTTSSEPRAALWMTPTAFVIFGESSSEAVAINDRGKIVGNLFTENSGNTGAVFWELKNRSHLHAFDKARVHCRHHHRDWD